MAQVVLWRGLAELAQKYLHKGSLVFVEGRLKTRNWEDKDKNKRFSTEIVADNLVMLDKRKDTSENGPAAAEHHEAAAPDVNFDAGHSAPATKDDLPF